MAQENNTDEATVCMTANRAWACSSQKDSLVRLTTTKCEQTGDQSKARCESLLHSCRKVCAKQSEEHISCNQVSKRGVNRR